MNGGGGDNAGGKDMTLFRYIIALDIECDTIEEAESYKPSIIDLIWSEVCSIGEPAPKVLDLYKVEE